MPGHVTLRLFVAVLLTVSFAVLVAPAPTVMASTPSAALAAPSLGTPVRRSAAQPATPGAGTPNALVAAAIEPPAASAPTAPTGAGSTDLPPPPAAGITPPAPQTLTTVPPPSSVAGGTAPLESTAPVDVPAGPMPAAPADRPVFEKWWFWTALGAVAITAVVIAASSSGPSAPATNLGTMTAF